MMSKTIFVYFFLLYVSGARASEPCSIHWSDDKYANLFKPLILTPAGDLHSSRDGEIKIGSGETALFTCQNNNFKKFPKVHEYNVTCADGKLALTTDAKTAYDFLDFGCDLRVLEELITTRDKPECPNGTRSVSYAYFDYSTREMRQLAEVCYDEVATSPRRIKLALAAGKAVLRRPSTTINSFVDVPLGLKLEVLKSHRSATTKAADALGEDFNLAGNVIQSVKLISGMFVNVQLRDAINFATNKAALWSSVAEGNWRRLEADVKALSNRVDVELEMGVAGAYGANGTSLFLDADDKMPLPRFAWATVRTESFSNAIITINDPFATVTQLKKDAFCESACDKVAWFSKLAAHNNYERPIYGYTLCCSVEDLERHLKTIQ